MAKVIKLEDDLNYLEVKQIVNNNTTYVYLTNVKDVNDFCIRKLSFDGNELLGLDNEEEFESALNLFKESMK